MATFANLNRHTAALAVGLAATLGLAPQWAAAQQFPTKPVRIITPFPVGGGPDGVVCVPAARAVETLAAAQKRESFEGEKRAKLASGVLGLDMYNMRPGLEKAGLRYID